MRPELLAPAGNPACALAAFDAGADAVYCGLKKFNARERTENFSFEEMDKIIVCAHKLGKKVFVTLNTLVQDSELPALGDTLAELDRLRPDALIVQDSGVLFAIRKYFPDLRVHASTQMGLHNSAGLALARELGIKRVILERQTTLSELELMMRNKPPDMEVEIFIHGALCCCISGSCLLSSWLGGWSGNRGKCKQPCRRRYHSSSGSGFFLSAQDLCTLELLPRILKTGVASLKIEGRLRRPDYVSRTVEAYRLALDAAMESPDAFRSALPRAREILARTCGRRWSEGFYTEGSAKTLVKYDSMGASGLLCGKVLSVSRKGFTLSAMRRIHVGDLLRIQPRSGDEGPAVSVTAMIRSGETLRSVSRGETCFIPTDREIPPDSFVYKTGESCPDYTRRIAALPQSKPALPLDIFVSRTNIRIRTGTGLQWEKEIRLDEAGRHPLSPERIEQEFTSASYDGWEAGPVRCTIEGNPFLPASVLKALRIEFREWIRDRFDPAAEADHAIQTKLDAFRNALNAPAEKQRPAARIPDSVILPRGKKAPAPGLTIIREMEDEPSPREELLLPFFVPETKLPEIRSAIRRFAEQGGKTVRITSLHHLALLKGSPLKIRTCMPLPVCSRFAVRQLAELGVDGVQLWLELGKTELERLAAASDLPAEIYRYGRPVLLTTRAAIPAGEEITDVRGNVFQVRKSGGFTRLTAKKVFSIPDIPGADCSLTDLRNADWNESDTASFNFQFGLQ
ncbi:MAG: U32 family peptidase [Lentisphaeria bacterium]|nr:U32 family peptidase [Lentisphaeria bacterium]